MFIDQARPSRLPQGSDAQPPVADTDTLIKRGRSLQAEAFADAIRAVARRVQRFVA